MHFKMIKDEEPGLKGRVYCEWCSNPLGVAVFESEQTGPYSHRAHVILTRHSITGATTWPILCLPSRVTAKMVTLRLIAELSKIGDVEEGAVDRIAAAIERVRHEWGMETVETDMRACGSATCKEIPWYFLTGKGTNFYGKGKEWNSRQGTKDS